jgi:hypothetical protein
MNESEYAIAQLDEDQVHELQLLEKKLSEKTGHPVTLIAYQEDQSNV